jgi:hypothetical protein
MNETAQQVVADVRRRARRRDWRWPAAVAAALLVLSVALAQVLTLSTQSRDRRQIEFLTAEVAAAREEVQAARARQLENQEILEGVRSLLADEAADEARREQIVGDAVDEIVRRIQAGIDAQAATTEEIRRLVAEQAEVSRRVDALLDQAESRRRPARQPPAPPAPRQPATTTTTAQAAPPAPSPAKPAPPPPPSEPPDPLLCDVLGLTCPRR